MERRMIRVGEGAGGRRPLSGGYLGAEGVTGTKAWRAGGAVGSICVRNLNAQMDAVTCDMGDWLAATIYCHVA